MSPRSPGHDPEEKRLAACLDDLVHPAGHAGRYEPLKDSCKGLLLPGERKSIGPVAARLHPDCVSAVQYSLHLRVVKGRWNYEAMLAAVGRRGLSALQQYGPIVAWMVDDTGAGEEGPALGWLGAAVLVPAGRATKLADGGDLKLV